MGTLAWNSTTDTTLIYTYLNEIPKWNITKRPYKARWGVRLRICIIHYDCFSFTAYAPRKATYIIFVFLFSTHGTKYCYYFPISINYSRMKWLKMSMIYSTTSFSCIFHVIQGHTERANFDILISFQHSNTLTQGFSSKYSSHNNEKIIILLHKKE